jgi:DNA-binding NarL/FixJ family response regulator
VQVWASWRSINAEIGRPTLAMTNDTRLIRILAVDDHPLLRSGIAALVDTQPDMQMVGEASNGNEAVQLHRELNPDVTLMDLQMPDMSGLDAIISIRTEQPSARIIVLTTYAGDVLAQRALKAGAQAYVLKSLVRTEILNTIRVVHAGEKQIQADVAAEMAKHTGDALLTTRELEVLKLVACGYANKVISARLDINEETTKTHVKNILAKLGARDRTHAVSLGMKRGIIVL